MSTYTPSSYGDPRPAAFARVRRVFGWTTAAAVAAVGTIVVVVAHEIPGRTSPPAGVAGSGASASAGAANPSTGVSSPGISGSSGTGTSLSPSATVPAPVNQRPTVVSGGSGF